MKYLLFAVCCLLFSMASLNAQVTIQGNILLPDGATGNIIPLKVDARFTDLLTTDIVSVQTPAVQNGTSTNYSISQNQNNFYVGFGVNVDPEQTVTYGNQPVVNVFCVKSNDINAIAAYLSGNITLTAAQRVAADVNIDNAINFLDFLEMNEVVIGRQLLFNNSLVIQDRSYKNVVAVFPTTADLKIIANSPSSTYYSSYYSYPLIPPFGIPNQNFVAIRLGDVNSSCPDFE